MIAYIFYVDVAYTLHCRTIWFPKWLDCPLLVTNIRPIMCRCSLLISDHFFYHEKFHSFCCKIKGNSSRKWRHFCLS